MECLHCGNDISHKKDKRTKFCNAECVTNHRYPNRKERVTECLQCGNDISHKNRNNKFCDSSCAGTYNNSRRKHSAVTKEKLSIKMKEIYNGDGNHNFKVDKETIKKRAEFANNVWKEKALKELMEADFSTLKYDRRRKRVILEQDGKCNRCGIDEWLEQPISLELEHKDGNTDNNIRENLEALCPNCHSQTDTFRGRNKKAGEKCPRPKITDEMCINAFLETGNIRQCLLQLGLAAKGANYGRVKKALTTRGIAYK